MCERLFTDSSCCCADLEGQPEGAARDQPALAGVGLPADRAHHRRVRERDRQPALPARRNGVVRLRLCFTHSSS